MIVEIVRSRPTYWYHGKEGTRFVVEPLSTIDCQYKLINNDPLNIHDRFIEIEDARIVSETSNHLAELTLIAPGSRGKIGEIDILITQVHIEFNQVEYTVAWWDDGQRYSERVPAYEITSAEKTMHVGFR